MSYVCPIHEQYVPDDKRCPYCVEPEAQPETYTIKASDWGVGLITEYRSPPVPLVIGDIHETVYASVTAPGSIWTADRGMRSCSSCFTVFQNKNWRWCACGRLT